MHDDVEMLVCPPLSRVYAFGPLDLMVIMEASGLERELHQTLPYHASESSIPI